MGRVERRASKIRRPGPPLLLDEPTLNESEMEMGGAEMHVRTDGQTDVRHSSEERSRSGEETLYLHT